jgi:hypothetical protein
MPKKFYCKNQKKIPDRVVRRATINLKRVALIFVENFLKENSFKLFLYIYGNIYKRHNEKNRIKFSGIGRRSLLKELKTKLKEY